MRSIHGWQRTVAISRSKGCGSVFAVLIALIPLATSAAQRAELQPGARMRVRAPSAVAGRVDGVILNATRDTLFFAPTGRAPLPIAMASITEAYIFRGRSAGAGAAKGALWGTGVGLAITVAVAGSGGGDCPGGGDSCKTTGSVASAAVYSGLGFGMIGALIGGIRGSERWEKLVLP